MKCHLLFGKVLVFFYYYLLLFRLLSSASGQVVASEKSILLEFKRSVSDPSGILSNWVSNSSSSNHCSWFGVSCDSNFRVSSLNITFISGKRGKYQAPTCSSKLSQFPYEGFGIRRVCSLSGKKLVGKLSPLIGNLTQLRVLSLPCNELCGEIPPEIFGLEKLEVLDLEGNLLNGKLIENFSGLRWLQVLNLGFNSIYGEIPDSLSKCTSLRILNLAGNQVNGSIPQFFSNFSRLEGLYLSQNRLTDYLPAQFGEGFQNLEHLDLSGNFLFGPIPSSLGNSLQLRTLLLFLNNFDDVIPPEFGRLQMLEVLDVSRNSLSGLIPAELGRCHKLSVLVLSNLYSTLLTKQNSSEEDPFIESLGDFRDEYNYFKGTIPDEITSLPNLRILWAPRSTLAGGLSSNWADCESLEMLNLAQNLLTGEIIGVFERCKNLHYLDLSSNRLTGKLDEKLPIPCIPFFDIGNNLISGPIPSYNYSSCPHRPSFKLHRLGIYNPEDAYLSFFTCQSRLIMDLPFTGNSFSVMHNFGSNNLSGSIQSLPIPLKMLGSRADYAFLADGNKLSGSFPGRLLERCDELKGMIANVSYNDLSGHIPFDVGTKCRSLRFMDASYNQISGSIPPSFGDFESLVVLDLSGNKLQGVIPNEVSRLKNLKYLSLASNGLTGSIPSSFTWLRSLQVLELSSNNISGEIPQGLVYLRRLTTLQLKNNKLSGKIPSGLANLKSLSSFNVSFNNLSGSIPLNYNNAMNCSSFLGNPFLYSCHIVSLTVPSPNLPDDYEGDSRDNKSSPSGSNSKRRIKGLTSIEIASIISASVIASVLLALVILFFYTRKWVPDSRIQVSESREITVFTDIGVQLTFDSIVRSTGNFSASNCIGNGGFGATYKAEISPGTIVAVKRLSVGRFQGVQQFHAEIKTLGRVRNPNLVTLIGYHASDTEMFLIYNYLPGGNLENFIKERLTRALDWKILHKIALDIARALAYLHDQCVPRVLHRDVKPSNILLDNEFNAYLSDFGLSRLLGTSETHATTGVAGTFGYVAPEYAMTCRVSEKADVYSYGVVLLELISDKKALDPSFSSHGNGFNIVSWACMQLRLGKANEVFTAGLWDVAPHDDLVQVLHLAVTCTVETLSTRPTMRQVVQRLKQVQPC